MIKIYKENSNIEYYFLSMKSITDIRHILYINLDSRPDRKEHVLKQLKSIGLSTDMDTCQRFPAIALPNGNGRFGCSMSHIKCLELAKSNQWEHVLIVEDDIEFLNPTLFQTQLNTFLQSRHFSNADVLLFAGNVVPPYKPIDNTCVQVSRCQTTTGYLVKSHYYDMLIANIREGLQLLMRNPEKHVMYAIDKWWFQLQQKDTWYLIVPLTVTQREDYSDIEKKRTNYTWLMTDLDKPFLRK